MSNSNIVKAGERTRFSRTRQPANRGRKPKLYTIAKEGYNLTLAEFREVSIFLMQATKDELERYIDDKSTPMWAINIARALHKDTGKGVTFTLREMLDRVYGRPGVTGNGDTGVEIDLSRLDGDEIKEYYALLSKAAGKVDE